MRKASLFAASCIAVVAFLGLSAQAFAVVDSDCDGTPYNNDAVIHDFAVDTPDSHLEHQVSRVTGGALACGTNLTLFGGDNTLYDHATISTPPGVVVGATAGMPNGSYAGSATVNVIYRAGIPIFQPGVVSTLTVDSIQKCQSENQGLVGGGLPGELVACLHGANSLGDNWNWTLKNTNTGRYTLVVGPMHGLFGISPGLTRVSMLLCDYPGTVGGSTCGGGSNQWMQINGDASAPDCSNGNGIYTVTATQKGGLTTPAATACVVWNAAKGKKNIDQY